MLQQPIKNPAQLRQLILRLLIWYAALGRRDAYNIFYSGTRPDGCRLALTALRRRRRLQQSIKVLMQPCQLVFALTNLEGGLERDVVAKDWPAFAQS
jgi:hypothetical protein